MSTARETMANLSSLRTVRSERLPRVEIPTHTDEWMRGDRFGVAERYVKSTGMTWVRLDKSGRRRRYPEAELRYLDND